VDVEQIAEGLWRWTARHPEWRPDADWPPDVGCVYYEGPDAVVLVDPLVPTESDERERFLTALDRDVKRAGRPLAIVITVHWHQRSADELAGRFGAEVWTAGAGTDPPTGVEVVLADRKDEVLVWIPEHRVLVAGDVLLGDDAGGVRLCPESWLPDGIGHAELRAVLRPLLELPIKSVLASHGEPVRSGAARALAKALDAPTPSTG
jgi:glyoxylase-like metal-dependent hydrolase (beta-lactamase superfamily II)